MRRKHKQKPRPVIETGLPVYGHDSDEAKAIRVLHDIVGRTRAFFIIFRRAEGVSFTKRMTEQLTAFAKAPPQSDWVTLTYQQAGSWEDFLRGVFDAGVVRQHLHAGSRAPWPWPPSVEGKLYPAGADPPLMTEEDLQEDFK
jgi:hypothetical protein